MSKRVSALLAKTQQKYFELGDKPHTLLARQLRQAQASRAIHKIKNRQGIVITDPSEINKCFAQFYEELYQSKSNGADPHLMNTFLADSQLPTLSEDAVKVMDADITLVEILTAISQFPNNKAPGPDGFVIEFYKKFQSSVAPLLLRMYNHSKEASELPHSLYQANIALILKKDRDPLDMSSYRPISLLPMEMKILSKLMANRLCGLIASLIHPDQSGFVPGRHIYSNLRRLFNIMYHKHKEESVIIALDIEKAFDSLEWKYMLSTLKHFGFGEGFIDWINIIYAHPEASIITNGEVSQPFHLQRGLRQGCSCSPYLFNLAIEILASQIRANQDIAPIQVHDTTHSLSLFADDMTLFISRPQTSIPPLLGLIESFGTFSGFRINWGKSELMPISDNVDPDFLRTMPFKVSRAKFKTLGIIATRKHGELLKSNWDAKMQQLKSNIEFWNTLPISMVGRINAIKMVALPRFLYIFQCLPVLIPLYYFKKLDSMVSSFIWSNKSVRITKNHLCKSKAEGGFGLPQFKLYYWAANLFALSFWRDCLPGADVTGPAWLLIERASVGTTSLPALLNNPANRKLPAYITNPIVLNSFKIWKQIQSFLNLPMVHKDSPICHNHAFPAALTDSVFSFWKERDIVTIKDLYENGTLMSFQQLQRANNLPATHFFRFLQIRAYLRTHIPNYEQLPTHNTLDSILIYTAGFGSVSIFYDLLQASVVISSDKFRCDWEKDLDTTISEDVWDAILDI